MTLARSLSIAALTAIALATLTTASQAKPMDGVPDPREVDRFCALAPSDDRSAQVQIYRDDEHAVVDYRLLGDHQRAPKQAIQGKPAEVVACFAMERAVSDTAKFLPNERAILMGQVESIYECPKCPMNADCIRCERDHVIFVAHQKPDGPAPARVRLWTSREANLKLEPGRPYRLRVARTPYPPVAGETNPGVELLAILPLPR